MAGMILSTALAIIAVGLLILVHEFGHFVAAKAVGVRVEIFSIGFWKKLVGFRKGDTEYRLSLIPLGGYVKLAGELPEESEGKPDEFHSKSPGQRALVFVAGVAFNVVFAVVGFVAAFSMGVPFPVAEVGTLEKGWPAWEAGLRRGDRIVRANDIEEPDFNDLTQEVALGGTEKVELEIEPGGKILRIKPRFREDLGFRWLGFRPPSELVVTGLARIGDKDGRCPAEEAGIEIGDRILAVAPSGARQFQRVETLHELRMLLLDRSHETVRIRLRRNGGEKTVTALTEPRPQFGVGISCVSTTVESMRKDGVAQEMGLRPGDKITAVNGREVTSIIEVEQVIWGSWGSQSFSVDRGGRTVSLTCSIPDSAALEEFLFSFECEAGTVLTWVREGSPAREAGMKVGDRLLAVAGQAVENWQDIVEAGAAAGRDPREMKWKGESGVVSRELAPVNDPLHPEGTLGLFFRHKTVVKQYGIAKALKTGINKTYGTVASILMTFRGFAEQRVSPKTLGGVVTIAYSSYLAAQQGFAKLLYLTAFISTCLAFLNILPIPVLDGGHLLFVAIEKIRGKPVPETVMAVAQYVGLALLLMLVIYVTKNDILRLLEI